MALVLQRISLALMLALGLSTVWVAASAWAAPGTGLASAAYAAQDDGDDDGGGDDDDGGDDGGTDDGGDNGDDGGGDDRDDNGDDNGGDDAGGDDRDDTLPEGGVETGGGGTAEQGGTGPGLLVPASLAGLATVGGGLLLWRRQAAQH